MLEIFDMEKDKESYKKNNLAEYIIDRILNGDVIFLGNEDIVKTLEQESSIKFERTNIEVELRKYGTKSKLFFIKKDDKLREFSSDVWIPAGATWETVFGFYFENKLPIRVHVYFIGKQFDLDKLSEMVYSLFTDSKDYIKTAKIAFKYDKDTKINKEFEKTFIQNILNKDKIK